MLNFQFCAPTKVVFGTDSVQQIGKLVLEQNGKKVLIHYGGGSAKRSGLLDRVAASLSQANIPYIMLGGVVPNPRLSLVRQGIKLCQQQNIDFILAVGGGSVIDSAKAIGYGIANPECDVWDFYLKKVTPKACAPIGAVLTIAAAGSEMSNSSVITNENGWLKRGLGCEICRCKFAVMDPTLTFTLPPYQTASGAADIMMHTIERYFTPVSTMGLTDIIAEGLIRSVMHDVKIALQNPKDYDARAGLMWASSLSHNDLTGCGTDRGDWACHQLEHELGGKYDIAHGAGLCAVWSSWARTVMPANPARFAKFAVNVMGVEAGSDDVETANRGIDALEEFFASIGMPTRINQMGINLTEADMEELAYKCSFMDTRRIGRIVPLDREAIYGIYKRASGEGAEEGVRK